MIGGLTRWEIVWTGVLPHLSGLPHLPGVPHLHVNRPLLGQLNTLYLIALQQLNFNEQKHVKPSFYVLFS